MIDPQDAFKLKICFNLLLGPRAPSPASVVSTKLFETIRFRFQRSALIAGEGARGPSKKLIVRIPEVRMFLFS
jgi:hypothetical protein